MAHIADCLFDSSSGLGLNNYIARELSPQRPRDEVCAVKTWKRNLLCSQYFRNQAPRPRKHHLLRRKSLCGECCSLRNHANTRYSPPKRSHPWCRVERLQNGTALPHLDSIEASIKTEQSSDLPFGLRPKINLSCDDAK